MSKVNKTPIEETKNILNRSGRHLLLPYAFCTLFYKFSKYSLQIIWGQVIRKYGQSIDWFFYTGLTPLILMCICGVITGYIVKRKIIFHASLATMLAAAFTYYSMDDLLLFSQTLLIAFILGGIGGGIIKIGKKFLFSKN